jgi:hypothetical protein
VDLRRKLRRKSKIERVQEQLEQERRTREYQSIGEILIPQIERVCGEFAKRTGWAYYKPSPRDILRAFQNNYPISFVVSQYSSSAAGGNIGHKLQVTLQRDAVLIHGEIIHILHLDLDLPVWNPRYSFKKSERIPVKEFTEERFARVFKNFYKEMHGL